MKRTLWPLTLCCLILTACSTSPTGRHQLKLFDDKQMANLGVQAFDSMKKDQTVSHTRVQNQFVQCVAAAITAQVPQSVFAGKWEVVVFDDPQINAFALPGGKIGVYTGLLKVTQNQAQLAAVLGHEVGHVIAGHSNERMSSNTLIGVGMEVTNQLLQTNQVANNNMIMAALGFGAQVGIQLPFSRTHESEADVIGLNLMAKAGFQPGQAINLWQNMQKANSGARQPEWLSTHPAPDTRIADLSHHLPQAEKLYAQAGSHPNCHK